MDILVTFLLPSATDFFKFAVYNQLKFPQEFS